MLLARETNPADSTEHCALVIRLLRHPRNTSLSSPSAAVKTLASLWLIVFVQRTGSLAQLPSSRGGAAASQVDFIVDSRATTADYT